MGRKTFFWKELLNGVVKIEDKPTRTPIPLIKKYSYYLVQNDQTLPYIQHDLSVCYTCLPSCRRLYINAL